MSDSKFLTISAPSRGWWGSGLTGSGGCRRERGSETTGGTARLDSPLRHQGLLVGHTPTQACNGKLDASSRAGWGSAPRSSDGHEGLGGSGRQNTPL